jgi:hypothetical protein
MISHLVLDDPHPIDAQTIAGITFQIYQEVSRHLIAINRRSALTEMWLAAFAPHPEEIVYSGFPGNTHPPNIVLYRGSFTNCLYGNETNLDLVMLGE